MVQDKLYILFKKKKLRKKDDDEGKINEVKITFHLEKKKHFRFISLSLS